MVHVSDLYIDFLKSTGNKWRTLRADPIKLSELYFQQDNVRCHVLSKTRQFCEQSLYSPDLNLLDRWVNLALKEHLRQFSFTTAEEVEIQPLQYLRSVPLEEYFEQISKLQRHCQRAIDQQGDYITD